MSLRTRLLVGLAVLVFAAVATAGWSVLTVARVKLREAEDARAAVVGAELATIVQQACKATCGDADVGEVVRRLVAGGAAPELLVVDGERRLVAGVGSDGARNEPALASALAGVSSVARRPDATYYYAPLRASGRIAGAVRVRLVGDAEVTRALGGAQLTLVAVTLLDGGLVLLFGALFIRRVVGPIEALSAAARRVADGKLDGPPLPSTDTRDEIGHLVDDFNRMTASLKQQREHLVAQEKLVTVGRLAAGVAHEIGNPLAAVLGYVELLLHDEPEGSERRETLVRVRRETERIRAIVADLLDYSKPPTGAVEPVRIVDAVAVALSLLEPQARFRDVEVVRDVPSEMPAAAASQSRLVQVLLNLLLNAADAMGGRGTVTLRARPVGDTVELRVADSGPGVREADRGQIFDPFFTTKEPGKGTGLGLSISRSIVEAYGGTLELAPSEKGATFVVRLPLYRV